MPPCDESTIKSGRLVIPYQPSDTGSRPIACDGSVAFWASSSVWLELQGDGTHVHRSRAAVDKTYVAWVQVTNNGQVAIDNVTVQAWVCNFSAGIGPSTGIASAGGATPMTGFVPTITPGTTATVQCSPPWLVKPGDVSFNTNAAGEGHVCMAVNAYSDTAPDGGEIPTASTFAMCCDCHNGQRNVTVEPVFTGQRMAKFQMMVGNPDETQILKGKVSVRPANGTEAFGVAERQLLIGRGLVENIKTLPPELIVLEEQVLSAEEVQEKAAFLINAQLLLNRPDPATAVIPIVQAQRPPVSFGFDSPQFGNGNDLPVVLQPGQSLPITLTFELNPNEPVGSVQAFDVVQTDEFGMAIGGARLVTVITPD